MSRPTLIASGSLEVSFNWRIQCHADNYALDIFSPTGIKLSNTQHATEASARKFLELCFGNPTIPF